MNTIDFLRHRVTFSGLPFGELESALHRTREGARWERAFRDAAHTLRRLAVAREEVGRGLSAAQAWLWTASAYQAATLGMHLDPEQTGWPQRIRRLRHLAKSSYTQALAHDGTLGRPVCIPVGAEKICGYLRSPQPEARGVVVLVNGLDSICEVELHRFGEPFLARGFATLALELPDTTGRGMKSLGFQAEHAASAIADWVESRGARGSLAVFGVSFGGHVAARLLAGDRRFRAAVAVSPVARLEAYQLGLCRIRRMLSLVFGIEDGPRLDAFATGIRLDALPSPHGRLLVLHMEEDELFGPHHPAALAEWAGSRAEVWRLEAEHVGTSRIHCWLPEVCDWLAAEM
jgi:dienelactone hydrolase